MNDIVIKNAKLVDGSGHAARVTDVSIIGDSISAVGKDLGPAKRVIDAAGRLLTPGFVDVHTHYDGQATWDPYLSPSCWHGVSTVVFGNCGVGFAPLKPGKDAYLINLMQGVEDIPEAVLAEGIDFNWESFAQYMASLESKSHAIDFGTQLPHGALRFYVMGERGSDHREQPSADELRQMTALVEQALEDGALGVTTSRTPKHRAADGRPTPSMTADAPELLAIAEGLRRAAKGVLQVNADFAPGEFELLQQAAVHANRPLSVLLLQSDKEPDLWRQTLTKLEAGRRSGLAMNGQVGAKAIGVMFAFDASRHPFLDHPAYSDFIGLKGRDVASRLRQQPERVARLLQERSNTPEERAIQRMLERSFSMNGVLQYEPSMSESFGARALREDRTVWAIALETLMDCDGEGLIMHPFENYSEGSLDVVREMIASEATIMGLSDAGAHVGMICDGAAPSFLLSYWARDRSCGDRLPLEFLVAKQTRQNALAYGLQDRGLIAPGMKADLNLIDFDQLSLKKPRIVWDLPAGGKRFVQRAQGYGHCFVSGVETLCNDEMTGLLPGQLIRGPQSRSKTLA
jgi:N-acyl-D-aspartate/D-glutamate deacylase